MVQRRWDLGHNKIANICCLSSGLKIGDGGGEEVASPGPFPISATDWFTWYQSKIARQYQQESSLWIQRPLIRSRYYVQNFAFHT